MVHAYMCIFDFFVPLNTGNWLFVVGEQNTILACDIRNETIP